MEEGMEIVLIEDNDEDARMLMEFLHEHVSNSIKLIQDGAEAAEYLLFQTDDTPRLILLDIILPSVDGIELFRIIRAEPAQRNLSVVFLISAERSKEYIESLGLHPDGFLIKPKGALPPVRI
jgi:CheY-like chemotaxis protein